MHLKKLFMPRIKVGHTFKRVHCIIIPLNLVFITRKRKLFCGCALLPGIVIFHTKLLCFSETGSIFSLICNSFFSCGSPLCFNFGYFVDVHWSKQNINLVEYKNNFVISFTKFQSIWNIFDNFNLASHIISYICIKLVLSKWN